MSNKANLTELLAESGGSARHKSSVIRQPATPANTTAPAPQGLRRRLWRAIPFG